MNPAPVCPPHEPERQPTFSQLSLLRMHAEMQAVGVTPKFGERILGILDGLEPCGCSKFGEDGLVTVCVLWKGHHRTHFFLDGSEST